MKKWILLIIPLIILLYLAYISLQNPKGCPLITPDLVGLALEDASTLLCERGVKLEVSDSLQISKTKPVLIVDQQPQPGVINCDLITVKVQCLH